MLLSIIIFFTITCIFGFYLRKYFPILITNENDADEISKSSRNLKYVLGLVLLALSIGEGLISSYVGTKAFEFVYRIITGLFQLYYNYTNDPATRRLYGELVNGLFSLLFSGFSVILMLLIFNIIIFYLLESIFNKVDRKADNKIFHSTEAILELLLLLPLVIFGLLIAFWTYFILFKGEFFNHSALMVVISGIICCLIAYIFTYLFLQLYARNNVLKLTNDNHSLVQSWFERNNSFYIVFGAFIKV